MEWFIIGRDMHVLNTPSTDSPESLPIYNDKQTILLSNNTVVSTYDFTVPSKHPDTIDLFLGNYIVFVDKYDKTRMYTLISHDDDADEQTWHAEDVGLDLLNETADSWDYSSEQHPLSWYFDKTLYDTGWTIGINEVSDLNRGLKFEGQSDTALRRLGDIANQFDGAEIDFVIKMNGSQVIEQKINIFKKIGSSEVKDRYVDAINLISLESSGSIEDLITAIKPYGSQEDLPENAPEGAEAPKITIADVEYDDGRYYSPKGYPYLMDTVARQEWSRFRGYNYEGQGEFQGYIVGIWNYETKDPQELLNRSLTELKKRNTPSEVFKANLLDVDGDIGDTIQIAHGDTNSPIYLSARIQQVEICYTENGNDTAILGDYTRLESQVDPRVKDMIDDLANKIKPGDTYYPWIRYAKDDKGTGMSATPTDDTTYMAVVMKKNQPVPSDDPKDYEGKWTKIKGSDGVSGEDGNTTYVHYAWADDLNGGGFSTSESVGKGYFGVYSDFNVKGSEDYKDYNWTELAGNFGNILDDIENNINTIVRVYTQSNEPDEPKEGDQWWQTDGDGNLIGYFVYDGTSWQPQTIQQSMLNIVKLNAVDITGANITGSKFMNNFDYKDQTGNQFVGTTTIENGKIISEYKLPLTNQAGKISFEPDGYHQIVYDSQGNAMSSINIGSNGINLISNDYNAFGSLEARDLDVAGPEIWETDGGGNGKYNIEFTKRWRRCWMSGVIVLPDAKFGNYKKMFTLANKKLWPKKTRYITMQSLGNAPLRGATLQIEANGIVTCIANEYGNTRYIAEGQNYSLD